MRRTKKDLLINPDIFDMFWEIMADSFPESERKSKENYHHQLSEKEFFNDLFLNETNQFMGFIAYWDLGEFKFIEHFAVRNIERNRGVGTEIFSEFVKTNSSFLLEVEPPLNETAKKRIRFYEKFGFHVLPYSYYQPSYHENRKDVDMLIMANIPKLSKEEFDIVRMNIYKKVYNRYLTESK